MGVAGSISPPGGAPKPDPERVATIRYTIVDEPETCAAFGENPRASLASLNDRALAEARNGDLGECSLLLDHVRDRVAGLDPARLVPRGGLAGLFDSRNKRLKAFRAAYASAASDVTRSAADIADRATVLAHKDAALETLWAETRDAIAELDAHIAAARGWLANEAPAPVDQPVEIATPEVVEETLEPETTATQPVDAPVESPAEEAVEIADPVVSEAEVLEPEAEPVASAETVAEPEAETDAPAPILSEAAEMPDTLAEEGADPVDSPEIAAEAAPEPDPLPELQTEVEPAAAPEPVHAPAPVTSLPHPLETRLAALEALRATAIGRLPLLRAAQNADHRTPAALKQVCDGVEAWRAEWQDALGLAGKRPKKVTPDRVRLSSATSALTDSIDAASRELSVAQGRRAELDARAAPVPTTTALAA